MPTSHLAANKLTEFSMMSSKMRSQIGAGGLPTGGAKLMVVRGRASALALGAALLFAGAPAFASTSGMNVDISTAITGPDSVSYSLTVQPIWAAFNVSITNSNPNNIPNGIFTFSSDKNTILKVPTITPTATASGTCRAEPAGTVNPTTILCNVAISGGALPFTIQAMSPTSDDPAALPITMAINWTVGTAQGSDSNNSGTAQVGDVGLVHIIAGTRTDLRGYADPQTPLAVTDPLTNNAATNVTPPTPVTISLMQDDNGSCASSDYLKCLHSTISIVDSNGNTIAFDPANPLVIDLFRPVATLVKGASIRNAVLNYTDANGTLPIIDCNRVGTDWQIPSSISGAYAQGRCVVPSKPTNKLTYSDKLGWHIRIIASSNGVVDW